MTCESIHLKNVVPREHQLKVANYINQRSTDYYKPPKALVVFHSVGTGKTITAILSASCFLRANPKSNVIILTPTSIVEQFTNEIKKMIEDSLLSRIHIYSHTWYLLQFRNTIYPNLKKQKSISKGSRGRVRSKSRSRSRSRQQRKNIQRDKKKDYLLDDDENEESNELDSKLMKDKKFIMPNNNMVIVDEAHKFRTAVSSEDLISLSRALNEVALRAAKILLLTATPIVNSEMDLRNYMAIIHNNSLEKEYKISTKLKDNIDFVNNYVNCGFSYFQTKDSENYPRVREHMIPIEMSPEYEQIYLKIQQNKVEEDPELAESFTSNPIPFLNGIRKAVNGVTVDSPKIAWIINKIKEEYTKGHRVVVYSAFKGFGVERVKALLDKYNIPSNLIIGNVAKSKRFQIVEDYNSGRVPILLISSAGAEGLDLKATRTLIIMEPFWNDARLEQVKGRAVRYRSHIGLPEDERVVDIYTLILTKPKPGLWSFKVMKAKVGMFIDKYLLNAKRDRVSRQVELATADEILLKLSEDKSKKILEIHKAIMDKSIENNKTC